MKNQASVLFVTIDGGGNLPPVLGLARRLSDRGHRVSVLSEPCMEEVILGMGFTFIPFSQYFTRKDRSEDVFKDSNVSPIKNPVLEKIVFGPSQIMADESIRAIGCCQADLLVADCLLPTALIAAEAAGIPGVLAFHMPEYFPGSNRPPGMFGLKPGKGSLGYLRDTILTKLFNMKIDNFLPRINETRSKWGLPPLKRTSDLIHGTDLRLIQTLESFDFPIIPRPGNVRYTGPILDDPDWTGMWTNPWSADDPRPLIVISLSSTFQNQHKTIQASIDALKDKDLRGLVTLGPALEKDLFDVPDNVIVVSSAPHSQVFPLADMVITHAGHGTIMKALSHGLPLVCLPMGRDQNDNAAKVEYHGCGISLSAKSGPQKIQKAVLHILADSKIKQQAAQFKEEILFCEQDLQIYQELDHLIGLARQQEPKEVLEEIQG